MSSNPGIDVETEKTLGIVVRALALFGGETAPVEPPPFAAVGDLETDLGHGRF